MGRSGIRTWWAGRIAVSAGMLLAASLGVAGPRAGGGPADSSRNDDPAGARPAGRASDPELASALEAFDAAQMSTTSIVAEFTEEKRVKLLSHPLVSHGLFTFQRPNQVRWEYREPEHRLYVITESEYLAYFPSQKKAEEVPISKFVGKRLFRFIGLGQSIADLETYYAFRLEPQTELPGTRLLVLTPRRKRIQDRIMEIRIWVDASTSLPRRFQYLEAGGDSTTITFREIRPNAEVGAGSFAVSLPSDVAVSSTFGGFALGAQGF